jgi:hypothetical protein
MSRSYDLDVDLSSVVLGTMRSPGVVTLRGHNREKTWDVKTAKGQVGASSSKQGDPIGEFTATFQLADDGDNGDGPGDFDVWEDFQRLLESIVDGPTPKALPIYHPDLARQHYTEVSVRSIGGMIHDSMGGATVEVKFIEYKPPKPKPAAKAQPKPYAQGNEGDIGTGRRVSEREDPNAAAKRELAGLLDEARQP